MSARSRLLFCVAVLGALHLGVACAGFFAPYDPVAQDREHPYAPPMRLHFVDTQGQIHPRPFFYAQALRAGSFEEYEENRARAIPVKFFVSGAPYHVLGVFPLRMHLFGGGGVPMYLLGSDAYGRDLLSRILFGGQVSLLAGLIGAGLTLSIGLCIGALAGFWGGWKDEVLMRMAELFLALPWIYLLFALRAFLPLTVPPLQAFLLVVMVIGGVGASGANRAGNCAEREGARFCPGGAGIWRVGQLLIAEAHFTGDSERCADAGGDFGAAVCARGDDPVVFGVGRAGAGADLGEHAGQLAALQ